MKTKAAYREFLKSDFWLKLSRKKRKKVGHCERCRSKKCLQAHHRFYRDNWYDTQEEDLEVLCRLCHQKAHGLRKLSKKDKKRRRTTPVGLFPGAMTWKVLCSLRSRNEISREEYKGYEAFLAPNRRKGPKIPRHERHNARWHPGMYEGLTTQQAYAQVG